MSEEVTKEPTDGQPAPDAAQAEQKHTPDAGEQKPAEGEKQEDQTTPAKSLLEEAEEDGGEEGEQDKKQEVPESYEDFKLPEGVVKDGPMLEAFVPLAKEAGLSQEMAQKFVDMGSKLVLDSQQAAQKAWSDVTTKWAAEIKADPEFGGAKFKENAGLAIKALNKYGDPETRKYLDGSRIANNPGLFKFMVRVGRTLDEDKLFEGGAAKSEVSTAKTIYPDWK